MSSKKTLPVVLNLVLRESWRALRIIKLLWISGRILCWLECVFKDEG